MSYVPFFPGMPPRKRARTNNPHPPMEEWRTGVNRSYDPVSPATGILKSPKPGRMATHWQSNAAIAAGRGLRMPPGAAPTTTSSTTRREFLRRPDWTWMQQRHHHHQVPPLPDKPGCQHTRTGMCLRSTCIMAHAIPISGHSYHHNNPIRRI